MELLIKNLSIGYEFALCENINLSLTTNNIHVLLGNNGKGKTTFLKTIAGILPPIKGSIQMDNKTKNSIAFVGTQKPHVEYLSVKEYWEFGIAKRDINLENKLIN